MLKKINVLQLQVGMYLEEFCCSWMEHPFWLSGFIITDVEDIKRIRASRITEVWIDSSKGIDIEPVYSSISLTEADNQAEEVLCQIDDYSPGNQSNLTESAFIQASELCTQARIIVRSLFKDARMGRAIDLEGANALVEQIVESVTRNRCALISLIRLKNASEFTYMHSVAVCALMISLAKQMEIDQSQVRTAGLAGLLHDIGKAAVPIEVLNKPGKLSVTEFELMKKHPEEGLRILKNCGIDETALDVCLCHHVHFDGTGYPEISEKHTISLYARMASICDVYDAISSNRPYKPAWDPAECIKKMAEWSSGHFDPVIFHAFVKSIGIYPVGSLVRLTSGRLAVVMDQTSASLLTPKIKAFFSTKLNSRIPQSIIDLSDPACTDRIEGRENPEMWNFPDIHKLWSGLDGTPQNTSNDQ